MQIPHTLPFVLFSALFTGFLCAQESDGVASTAQVAPQVESAFPVSTALAEGVSPEALANLDQLIKTLVEEGEIVGGEILVIKNGRTILNAAHGWSDRESKRPMTPNSVFCVRSMTKPLIGASILMLVDDDLLELDDRVSQFLPSFDAEGTREITVEQLLTHTSGLPMSLILGSDHNAIEGIRGVAKLGGGSALDFKPGSEFQYSDQGTDTLTALIEVVSGQPAADFVKTRVLDPLGMKDSVCVLGAEHPLRQRAHSLYVGSPGYWTRFLKREDPPMFEYFLGSQGLYSTTQDYARFLDFWQRRGKVGKERLLRARHVRKALTTSGYPMRAPTGFPSLRVEYGYLMQLWTGEKESDKEGSAAKTIEREVVAFGHTGSDGTHAWMFPKEKAMVLFFTQSRGTNSGLRVEEALGDLLLGVPYNTNQAAPPLEEYLGYYRENDDDLYRAIIRDGEFLALEVLGKGIVPLSYLGEDRWKMKPNPSVVLAFDRDEAGFVTGFHIGEHQEFRFEPGIGLPSAKDVAAQVAKAHGLHLLETVGPIQLEGTVEMEKLGLSGTFASTFAWPNRFRLDLLMGDDFETTAFDGEHVRTHDSAQPDVLVEQGVDADTSRRNHSLARFGDWSRWYPQLTVIQQLERGGNPVVLVRTGDTSAPARTLYVNQETGLVMREDSHMYIKQLGRISQRLTFGDYREVAGMQWPYRTRLELANPMIGAIESKVESFVLGETNPAGWFELAD